MTIHIVYENPTWLPPLTQALESAGLPYRLVELVEGLVDPAESPAEGIWLNRVSPSSHTRGHNRTVDLARELFFQLELHGRRVINGSHALELEVSKLRQDLILRKHGILTPKTVLAVGRDALIEAARRFDGPFITKHNMGGKGLGIQRFNTAAALEQWIDDGLFDAGPDGKVILQQYIEAPEPFITRVEIVGGQFVLAMRSNTEQGFQLCPSDACQAELNVCPIDGGESEEVEKFQASPLTSDDPLVKQLVAMTVAEGLDVAGIEFIEDADGNRYVYDINGTTNYNAALGERIGIHGMERIAQWIQHTVLPREHSSGALRSIA